MVNGDEQAEREQQEQQQDGYVQRRGRCEAAVDHREDAPQPRQSEQRRQRQRIAHHKQQVQRGGENEDHRQQRETRLAPACGHGLWIGKLGWVIRDHGAKVV